MGLTFRRMRELEARLAARLEETGRAAQGAGGPWADGRAQGQHDALEMLRAELRAIEETGADGAT